MLGGNSVVFMLPGWIRSLGSWGTDGVLLFGGCDLEVSGRGRVADCGLVIDAEDSGQMQGVALAGERLIELPVDTESFQGRGEAAERAGGPQPAGRAEFHCCLLGDQ